MLLRAVWLSSSLLAACSFSMPEPSALEDAAADTGAADSDTAGPDQDGWRWHAVKLPFANTIHGLWGEREDLWAVGNGGLIAHYDGNGWTKLSSPTKEDLQSVWGPTKSELWAVGARGTILRLTGGVWEQQASPVQSALYDIWGSGAADIWAVGSSGTLLHFDGGSWSASTEGSDDLRGVWGTSAQDVWAVGANGALLHWKGSGWASSSGDTDRTIFGIWARSSQEVWATAAGGSVLRYDGKSWSKKDLDTGVTFRAAGGLPAAGTGVEVWIVGDRSGEGVIYGLQGGSWQPAGTYPGTILHEVWVAPTGEAWAAGGGDQEAYRYGP